MAPVFVPIRFINALVGRVPSRNDLADVIWVQGLLNRWLRSRSKPPIGLDGECGKATIDLITEFQSDAVKMKDPDGRVGPGDDTAQRLLDLRRADTLKVNVGKNFVMSDQGTVLDKTLYERVLRLCQCLLDLELVDGNIRLNQGVRAKETAHKWSTSWNVRKRHVPLKALQSLKEGKDADGNTWYDVAWEADLRKDPKGAIEAASLKKLWDRIDANARTYYASDAVAAEGYRQSDARVKPNVHKALSNHIDGRAMDVSIPWKAGARIFGKKIVKGANSEEAANRLVRAFHLSRPVKSERWHFQLPADDSRGFTGAGNLSTSVSEEGPQAEQ